MFFYKDWVQKNHFESNCLWYRGFGLVATRFHGLCLTGKWDLVVCDVCALELIKACLILRTNDALSIKASTVFSSIFSSRCRSCELVLDQLPSSMQGLVSYNVLYSLRNSDQQTANKSTFIPSFIQTKNGKNSFISSLLPLKPKALDEGSQTVLIDIGNNR